MQGNEILMLLQQKLSLDEIQQEVLLSRCTSFKIGGPADFLVTPHTQEGIRHVVTLCKQYQIPLTIIGNGSNLLVSDKGVRGIVLKLGKEFSQLEIKEDCIEASSGILLSRLAFEAAQKGLQGLEFAHGIPGSLGGALVMNAGAYGREMKDVVVEATVMDFEGNIKHLTKEELALDYRTSILQKEPAIVLEVILKLEPGDPNVIQEQMKELLQRRRDKQPLEYGSAGSTFKRPTGYFAGALIEQSGLKGYQIGGAQVSDKHCGFIINKGEATFQEVMDLINHVKKTVWEHSKVLLEEEVKIIGEQTKN